MRRIGRLRFLTPGRAAAGVRLSAALLTSIRRDEERALLLRQPTNTIYGGEE